MNPALRAALVAALALGALSGCGIFKDNEQTVAVINARALGMPVGEFFDRYGRPQRRDERTDGGLEFIWVSSVTRTQGRADVDDQVCSLRLTTDRGGRISSAQVMYDGQGKTRMSRCAEIFAAS
jgi:hypothetical protein